jgi:rubredoxin
MQWVCDICGYVHDDENPPDICPVCGAPKSKFSEKYDDQEGVLDDEYAREERDDDSDDFYGEYDE